MYNKLKSIIDYLILFILGGGTYVCIELTYRGRSHWTMFILGGLCFICCGALNEHKYSWDMALNSQMLYSALIITILEFICGLIVNKWLKWNVWDYSNMKFNILGQVSLLYSIMWYFLSGAAILIDDWIRWIFFGEDRHPRYHFF